MIIKGGLFLLNGNEDYTWNDKAVILAMHTEFAENSQKESWDDWKWCVIYFTFINAFFNN